MVRQTVLRVALLASLALTAAVGCGKAQTGPDSPAPPGDTGGGPTAADLGPNETEAPTAQVSTNGVEPYVVGAKLDALKAAGALANVKETTGCPGWATADASGPLAGTVLVSFHNGSLAWLEVKSGVVSTVEGAYVGMTQDELRGMYSGRSMDLADGLGGAAIGVRDTQGGTGMVFRLAKDGTVGLIDAGTYDSIELRFRKGQGC